MKDSLSEFRHHNKINFKWGLDDCKYKKKNLKIEDMSTRKWEKNT